MCETCNNLGVLHEEVGATTSFIHCPYCTDEERKVRLARLDEMLVELKRKVTISSI